MRLIDADVALQRFIKETETSGKNAIHINTIKRLLQDMDTAYDVEKVVEELEKHKTQYGKLQFAHNDANMVSVYVGKEQAIDCAIDIVRKGSVK
ncbi:MAG: hypothetical protein IJN92_09485 [Lachnospiraceae bacterium]|nr:hypothetical protein [Lachnospiraceae bacterium]